MFLNISLNLALSISVVALLISVVLYFIVFRKYNKRNGLSVIDKLCNCGEFSSKTALHVFMIVLGLDYFIEGMLLIESVYERYANYVVAVIVISLTIFHYIKYSKKFSKLSLFVSIFLICSSVIFNCIFNNDISFFNLIKNSSTLL